MSIVDVILAVVIIALAGWTLYLSLRNEKGPCAGCTSCNCGKYKRNPDGLNAIKRTFDELSKNRSKGMIRLALAIFAAGFILLLSTYAYAAHPLVTDDAGTAGRGKGQVEIGFQLWHDKETNDESTRKTEGGELSPAITIGLHDRVDLVATIPYQWRSEETDGVRTSRANGISHTGLDLKWRFFDHSGWGLALKPGVSFPTGDEDQGLDNGRTVYRLFFITTKEVGPAACHMNLGYIRSPNNAGNHQDLWHASLAVEYEVIKNLKIMGNAGMNRNPVPGSSTHPAFILGGAAYSITDKIIVDAGIKYGLNYAETDMTYLFGMTFKF